ncbi:putative serine/threonine-protein kinase PBL18 [Nicotiana tabacum]|uniref:Probable receptor-like protein kinase At5g56460 n=1 Tax=Nicotiana tabacum TaxID=4097 RepID=A0A1S3YXD6_TOBAC|nr:probable serine/threonine-protein kinase PBL18 [Nicotiana tomentosiformis]XP_016457001.1 PREDICTED: probable receptor-like protein kinase At5g56460 [Nicotiana tabacum]
MTDVQIRDEEEKRGGFEMIRKKLEEWDFSPYYFQIFNKEESPNWRHPMFIDSIANGMLAFFYERCNYYQSFKFSIEPMIVGEVKLCTYSELQNITDFKPESLIQKTLSGRLFCGTIGEGSEKRPAIVKTWDFLLPLGDEHTQRLHKFCDEIELFTDERVNTHPNLSKLYRYCYETRLAAVYDEKFTRVLSDVLLADDFGWDDRIKVATQLADLLAWLHEKSVAVGSVTASCIMIDEEVNIKVFDFGHFSNHVSEDCKIPVKARVGREAPEVVAGERTMKSDVYIFGLLLLELISKKKFNFRENPVIVKNSVLKEASLSEKYLVNECFKEVDHPTAFDITRLVFLCMNLEPEERPMMKDVLDALRALSTGVRGEKRKRNENEAE